MRLIGILGIVVFLLIAFIFSKNRHAINWYTVCWGLGLQILFAFTILGSAQSAFIAVGIFLLLLIVYAGLTKFYVHRNMIPFMQHSPKILFILLPMIISGLVVFSGYHLGVRQSNNGIISVVDPIIKGIWVIISIIWICRKFIKNQTFHNIPINMVLFLLALSFGLGSGMALSHATHQQLGTMVHNMNVLSRAVSDFLSIPTSMGTTFMYGHLSDPTGPWGFLFFIKALSVIIFFSAFISVLYYLGIVQVIIDEMAKFMRWTMKTSGAETLSCSSNIFVGQTEAPILIKPFVPDMTLSEIHAVMTGGFATIAGSVFAGYVAMGINAGYLLGASIMSAPAALMISKIWYPETEKSQTDGDTNVPNIPIADNIIGAAAVGTSDGIQLAINVGGMLIAFIALIEVVNMLLRSFNPEWNLDLIFGSIFQYLAMIMGVPKGDAASVGMLLGNKIAINEFVAYANLSELLKNNVLAQKSQIIATYALCGFANFSSIGIQIAGISYMAPNRRSDIAKLGFSAMWAGAFASWITACIAGIFVG